jgi:AcrR family transcriptional regulator
VNAAVNASAKAEVNSGERPLRADARRNRARVLEAAAEAFAAEGPTVPLDEIARRAGVGAGTVYRHFPTKEALLQAVLTDRLEILRAKALEALAAPEPGPAFFTFFETMATSAENKMDLAEALARQGIDVLAATREVAASLKAALGELLRRAQDAGAVRTDVGIEDLHAMVVGAVAAARASASVDVSRVTGLVADGLRPRPVG